MYDWPVQSVSLHYVVLTTLCPTSWVWEKLVIPVWFAKSSDAVTIRIINFSLLFMRQSILFCQQSCTLQEWRGWNFSCEVWKIVMSFWYLQDMLHYSLRIIKKKYEICRKAFSASSYLKEMAVICQTVMRNLAAPWNKIMDYFPQKSIPFLGIFQSPVWYYELALRLVMSILMSDNISLLW